VIDNDNNGAAEEQQDEMEQFFTEERASCGIKLHLEDAKGKSTKHWMQIRGLDSEEFRIQEMSGKREAQKISALKSERAKDEAIIELSRRLTATLVMAWSFPEPCTKENVIAFLKKAPQIEKAIDKASGSRKLFSMLGLPNSSGTSGQSTHST
jgi:hypothetical protein